MAALGGIALALTLTACGGDSVRVVGRPGLGDGEFREPRAVAASIHGLAVIDRSARLQVFGTDGTFRTAFALADPDVRRGLPIGVTWLADGTLAVADTHQSCIRFFAADGTALGRIGENGLAPGRFLNPQRIAVTASGRLAVTDHGVSLGNRVQVLGRDGSDARLIGGPAPEHGGLVRPMGIVELPDGRLVVADQRAGLVAYAPTGEFVGAFTTRPLGEGSIAYGLCRADDGTLYVADIGRSRRGRDGADGAPRGTFGGPGDAPGRFAEPWDVAWWDGRLYVADRGNHRVQSIDPGRVEWREP